MVGTNWQLWSKLINLWPSRENQGCIDFLWPFISFFHNYAFWPIWIQTINYGTHLSIPHSRNYKGIGYKPSAQRFLISLMWTSVTWDLSMDALKTIEQRFQESLCLMLVPILPTVFVVWGIMVTVHFNRRHLLLKTPNDKALVKQNVGEVNTEHSSWTQII